MTERERTQLYQEAVGHPPRNLPSSHPSFWQWHYQGTRTEREKLRERLELALPRQREPALF
jgi:hypothetical protein